MEDVATLAEMHAMKGFRCLECCPDVTENN